MSEDNGHECAANLESAKLEKVHKVATRLREVILSIRKLPDQWDSICYWIREADEKLAWCRDAIDEIIPLVESNEKERRHTPPKTATAPHIAPHADDADAQPPQPQ